MANFPLLLRYKRPDGSVGPQAHADHPVQALDFLAQWRKEGFAEFVIEDATGQPIKEADLNTSLKPGPRGPYKASEE
jgi:hypothetical protein